VVAGFSPRRRHRHIVETWAKACDYISKRKIRRRKLVLVEYRVDQGIAILEFNNPPANAYTLESLKELDAAIVRARFDSGVQVIVLRGAGDKFFSAGADINMLSKETNDFRNQFALYGHETLSRLENTPKLVIAAMNGHCVGGGLEIAMACDIRI